MQFTLFNGTLTRCAQEGRKTNRADSSTASYANTFRTAAMPARQRARVQFHVYESDKSEKCISRAPTPKRTVFSHLDAEICFSGRGSYSSLMKRAIALVSIFPCKSNKLFGHGRRTDGVNLARRGDGRRGGNPPRARILARRRNVCGRCCWMEIHNEVLLLPPEERFRPETFLDEFRAERGGGYHIKGGRLC